jgi:tellurite resistance protein TehA-like permease
MRAAVLAVILLGAILMPGVVLDEDQHPLVRAFMSKW